MVGVSPAAVAGARLAVTLEGPLTHESSPGVAVRATFVVRNEGDAVDAVNFTLAAPPGWRAVVLQVATASGTTGWRETLLAPGASARVLVEVVPGTTPRQSQVFFRAVGGAETRTAYLVVELPTFVTLAMHHAAFGTSQRVSGEVRGQDLDGSPAAGGRIGVVEVAFVGDTALPFSRKGPTIHLDDAGAGSFAFPVDVAGSNLPGRHRVVASSLEITNPGSSATAWYTVR